MGILLIKICSLFLEIEDGPAPEGVETEILDPGTGEQEKTAEPVSNSQQRNIIYYYLTIRIIFRINCIILMISSFLLIEKTNFL